MNMDRKDRYKEYTGIFFDYKYPYTWEDRSFNYLEIIPDRDWKETQDWIFPDACRHCPNHPKNGGSSVCHCILGQPKVTC